MLFTIRMFVTAALVAVAILLQGCSIPAIRATAEEQAAYELTVAARTPLPVPALPTVTPDLSPCDYVKGNIDRQGRKLYHLPGTANYDQVVIDEAAGEKVFCTEAQAQEAGFMKAGN